MNGSTAHLKAPPGSIARAAWIIFPQYQPGAAPTLTLVAPARAFMDLAANSFNYSLLGPEGFSRRHRQPDSGAVLLPGARRRPARADPGVRASRCGKSAARWQAGLAADSA